MAPLDIRRWSRDALGVALLFLAYFFTARFGLLLDAVSGFATLVWPPTGIALAALLLFGRRLWPGVLLGAACVNLIAGASLPVALAKKHPRSGSRRRRPGGRPATAASRRGGARRARCPSAARPGLRIR